MQRATEWDEHQQVWLAPFLAALRHKARRRMLPLYVSGLIGPGERKSMQPMASRLAAGDYDQLHHFVAAGLWDEAPLEAELLVQADKLVGGGDAVLVIGDTALPKKGKHSVGVAAQYVPALGKSANCQTLVSLALVRGDVPVTVALRLFLPENWASHPDRLERAGVPAACRAHRTKPAIALAELDRLLAGGVRFGCVLAHPGYGLSASFRRGLTERGLAWVAGISRHEKVQAPDLPPLSAEAMLAEAEARDDSRHGGRKGPLQVRFAAVRVRTADSLSQREDKRQPHVPGDDVWLIGEHRASGERRYFLANLPPETDLRTLARIIRAREAAEQADRQLKDELGLDHFEGRSWSGLHRHALMTMIAFAFLQSRHLAQAGQARKRRRSAAATNRPPGRPDSHAAPASSAAPGPPHGGDG
ncbi:IS701 family transposase [Phreatobacter stygius]|uniref:IS701 family transposase n=1 Tax=Phreatobacter stygius TaxID=1940610 RepID=UPI001FE8D53E|nr:IS701 family transposase [Phreatobacter stygius]